MTVAETSLNTRARMVIACIRYDWITVGTRHQGFHQIWNTVQSSLSSSRMMHHEVTPGKTKPKILEIRLVSNIQRPVSTNFRINWNMYWILSSSTLCWVSQCKLKPFYIPWSYLHCFLSLAEGSVRVACSHDGYCQPKSLRRPRKTGEKLPYPEGKGMILISILEIHCHSLLIGSLNWRENINAGIPTDILMKTSARLNQTKYSVK